MVDSGTCTPTLASVCIGDDDLVMELDHLDLADYRASSAATYPAVFGGQVKSPFDLSQLSESSFAELNPADLGFVQPDSVESIETGSTVDYSNISSRCYDMLER